MNKYHIRRKLVAPVPINPGRGKSTNTEFIQPHVEDNVGLLALTFRVEAGSTPTRF